jgi:hypothetical protein
VISNLNKDLLGQLLMGLLDSDTLANFVWDIYGTVERKLITYGKQQYS